MTEMMQNDDRDYIKMMTERMKCNNRDDAEQQQREQSTKTERTKHDDREEAEQ